MSWKAGRRKREQGGMKWGGREERRNKEGNQKGSASFFRTN